jgi:hypothetical protein
MAPDGRIATLAQAADSPRSKPVVSDPDAIFWNALALVIRRFRDIQEYEAALRATGRGLSNPTPSSHRKMVGQLGVALRVLVLMECSVERVPLLRGHHALSLLDALQSVRPPVFHAHCTD